jgi:hypothetical protein
MTTDGTDEQAAGSGGGQPQPEEPGSDLVPAAGTTGRGVPQYVTHIQSAQGTINIGPTLNLGVQGAPAGGPARGDWSGTPYDVGAIRRLLLAAFTPQDLVRFCQDEAVFRPVGAYFGPGQGLIDMVDKLLDYCRTQALWEELLAAVRQARPRQYERFAAEIGGAGGNRASERVGTIPRQAGQAERLASLRQRVRGQVAAPQRQEALTRVEALRQVLSQPRPDLGLLESTWQWFRSEIPALAGPVLSAILAAGRDIQEGDDDELWAEFQDRFGEFTR